MNPTNHLPALRLGLAIAAASGLLAAGCATTKTTATAAVEKSGAQLWADNCQRCHNFRSPTSLSPMQWEVAMLHMRDRANLTREEHEKILAFLKTST